MRKNIVHPGADKLEYEIRSIIDIGKKLQGEGMEIIWENIGDPLAKGEKVEKWIKEIIAKESLNDSSYAYCPTLGLEETREYISNYKREFEDIDISKNDILFFNGLGDAISTIYSYLNKNSKIIGPSPAYPTHSSAESAQSESEHITYNLNPENNWEPDLKELENKIIYNPSISGILIINPDNPTGFLYSEEVLKKIVFLAKKYGLFIISDEIYKNLTFNQKEFVSVGKIASKEKVPAIILRGLSKEVPWPGSRCGWAEFVSVSSDKNFKEYVNSLLKAKMLEVCSTTLPQRVIPKIFQDKRYLKSLRKRTEEYKKKADWAVDFLEKNENILVPKPKGAFYLSIVFKKRKVKKEKIKKLILKIKNKKIREIIEDELKKEKRQDKIFVILLMALKGICAVPLTSFNTEFNGIRITLLEKDWKKFQKIIKDINFMIEDFFEFD